MCSRFLERQNAVVRVTAIFTLLRFGVKAFDNNLVRHPVRFPDAHIDDRRFRVILFRLTAGALDFFKLVQDCSLAKGTATDAICKQILNVVGHLFLQC